MSSSLNKDIIIIIIIIIELTLSGSIIGSRVDTAGDNQSPNVIISKYLCDRKLFILLCAW